MKQTNLYFSKLIAMLSLALFLCAPVKAAFSLIHRTDSPMGVQDNGMQAVHTEVQVIYARPGDTVRLHRPDRCALTAYLRWYCYDTDRAVPQATNGDDRILAAPALKGVKGVDTYDLQNV